LNRTFSPTLLSHKSPSVSMLWPLCIKYYIVDFETTFSFSFQNVWSFSVTFVKSYSSNGVAYMCTKSYRKELGLNLNFRLVQHWIDNVHVNSVARLVVTGHGVLFSCTAASEQLPCHSCPRSC